MIACLDDGIKLVTELFDTVRLDRHTHSYVVQKPSLEGLFSSIRIEDLLDFQPYHAAKSYNQTEDPHIVLRHQIH